MPTQDDIDWNNTVSKNRQRESRAARRRSKDVQKERSSRLRAAESTGERREIKNQYQKMEGGVWDVSTSQTEVFNNEGDNTDISSSAGVDSAFDRDNSSQLSQTIDILVCNSETGISETLTIYYVEP
jgi:hypothetical protein